MNFNTFLLRVGIEPDNFVNREEEPIIQGDTFIYDVEQDVKERQCPYCNSRHLRITGYYYTETRCNDSEYFKDLLRIKRVRLRCLKCNKTHSPQIRGIDSKKKITRQVEQCIYNDFATNLTFAEIAKKYDYTKARIIQLFDDKYPFVPRRPMPKVLCIDEIRFSEDCDQKYCCVLYDFEKKEIVDIIRNRQMPYLREYFDKISAKERENTQYFISDMYDGYGTVCSKYFPKATHIIDMFHIVTQLTRAVNTLRVNTMNGIENKNDPLYVFMKSKWKYFLCRNEFIPNKIYTCKRTNKIYEYPDLVFDSVLINERLHIGYSALQDLYHFPYFTSFNKAYEFIGFLSNRLCNSGSLLLEKVGNTYKKWRIEISSAYSKGTNEIKYTNAIAECINNQLKTIIKSAYGYKNFSRFRKRAMLMLTYSKKNLKRT